MDASAAAVAAYVLHSRSYRESGAIVDFLTRDHGRSALFAHGVAPSAKGRRRRAGIGALLQPFTAVLVGWRGPLDGGQLQAIENAGPPLVLPPHRVMSGFYLNELLLKLLHREDPHPEVFDAYHGALLALAAASARDEPARLAEARALRRFEYALLESLGLCADFAHESGGGAPVEPTGRYQLRRSTGLVAVAGSMPGFSGAHLLSLVEGRLDDEAALLTARAVLRELLDAALDGRPLLTRRVARSVAGLMAATPPVATGIVPDPAGAADPDAVSG